MTASPAGHPRPVDEVGAGHDADGEPGQVVVVAAVEVRQLRRLAADERDARRGAGGRHPADDLVDHLRAQVADAEVVEEEERVGAGARRCR